jgi:hypothetical protein
MKLRREILITGTRLEIAVSTTKHSVAGRSNNRRGRGAYAESGREAFHESRITNHESRVTGHKSRT